MPFFNKARSADIIESQSLNKAKETKVENYCGKSDKATTNAFCSKSSLYAPSKSIYILKDECLESEYDESILSENSFKYECSQSTPNSLKFECQNNDLNLSNESQCLSDYDTDLFIQEIIEEIKKKYTPSLQSSIIGILKHLEGEERTHFVEIFVAEAIKVNSCGLIKDLFLFAKDNHINIKKDLNDSAEEVLLNEHSNFFKKYKKETVALPNKNFEYNKLEADSFNEMYPKFNK